MIEEDWKPTVYHIVHNTLMRNMGKSSLSVTSSIVEELDKYFDIKPVKSTCTCGRTRGDETKSKCYLC